MGLACVSVDLDSLVHYCRIHGVRESVLDERGHRAVYATAVPRLLELFDKVGVPCTLFVIGEDLQDEVAQRAVREAHRAGVELGNHTWRHDYALTRREYEEIFDEVERGAAAIARVTGQRPRGFRAPGYTLTAELYRAVRSTGHHYDSSVFPAAPYWAAKAAVMGTLALLGRRSRAVLDSPSVLAAPRLPYFPSVEEPYRRGEGEVLELPVATAPWTRFPFIGTFALTLPPPVVRALFATFRGQEFFNLELHALDVLDEGDGIPPALSRQQRDARVPARVKLARLEELLRRTAGQFELTTLAQAAHKLAPRARGVV